MNHPVLTAVAFALALTFARFPITLSAQETKPPEPVKLEDVPARLSAIDEELNRKADETRTVVEREAAAKRLPDSVAQSLRWSLRTAVSNAGTLDVRGAIATARVPADNEAITEAFKALEETNTRVQKARTELITSATESVRLRVIAALRTATTEAEAMALQKVIETTRDQLQRNASGPYRDVNVFNAANSIVAALASVLRDRNAGDSRDPSFSLGQLSSSNEAYRDPVLTDEVRAAVKRAVQPQIDKEKAARAALENAIIAGKNAEELSAMADAVETASENFSKVRLAYNEPPLMKETAATYRRVVEALSITEGDEAGLMQSRMNDAQNAIRQLDSPNASKLSARLKQRQQEIADQIAKAALARTERIKTRLGAAKTPEDLESVAAEVTALATETRSRTSGEQEKWGQLANALSSFATVWRTGSLNLLAMDRYGETRSLQSPFAPELQTLRQRIERETLSRALQLPELLTPPLGEQPVDTAINTIADQLAAKGEWRQLYRLLETRATLRNQMGGGGPDEAMMAIRAFLTGQNLELAEQWTDARLAYKQVLSSASERGPIKEAAERLKNLDRQHPAPPPGEAGATEALPQPSRKSPPRF